MKKLIFKDVPPFASSIKVEFNEKPVEATETAELLEVCIIEFETPMVMLVEETTEKVSAESPKLLERTEDAETSELSLL